MYEVASFEAPPDNGVAFCFQLLLTFVRKRNMPTASQTIDEADLISRHEKVDFHFLGAGEDVHLSGTALVRRNDMVISIRGGYGPYEIVGECRGHVFAGENSHLERRYDVKAKWSDLGGIFVGEWLENNNQFLFSFVLPRNS
jgi:hypothetical protein